MKVLLLLALVAASSAMYENWESIPVDETITTASVAPVPEEELEEYDVDNHSERPHTLVKSHSLNEQAHREAQSLVSAMSKKKGGDSACRSVAKDLDDIVRKNVVALQKAQNAMDKGAKCSNAGQSGVKAAAKTLRDAESSKNDAHDSYNKAANAKIDFGKKRLNELNPSSCVFFKMSVYTQAVAKRTQAKKKFDKAKGAVTAAKMGLKNAENAAKKDVLKCKCDVAKSHSANLSARNASAEKANKKGWTKAAHLRCVLDGKTAGACKVSAIPKVKAAKGLCKGCDKSSCDKLALFDKIALPNYPASGCSGFKVINAKCGGGNVALATSKSTTWVKKQVYSCPAGWYWPKAAHFFNYLKNNYGCYGNNGKAGSLGAAHASNCGWSGYTPPGAPGSHYYFRFSDSRSNHVYQHAGNYIGLKQTNSGTAQFAGIACMKNGY